MVTLLKFKNMLNGQISIDPEIMSGDPVFAGTRVPVQTLFDYLEGGDDLEMFLADFASVTKTAAIRVLEMAKTSLTSSALVRETQTKAVEVPNNNNDTIKTL